MSDHKLKLSDLSDIRSVTVLAMYSGTDKKLVAEVRFHRLGEEIKYSIYHEGDVVEFGIEDLKSAIERYNEY